jgi:hypothetical protein
MFPDALNLFEAEFELVDRKDGTDRGLRPSAWFEFRRKTADRRRMTVDGRPMMKD